MGTYLSAFIEFDRSDMLPAFSDTSQIESLTEASFSFGKDYEVFDALGDGRNGAMRGRITIPCRRLSSPRGGFRLPAISMSAGPTSIWYWTMPSPPTATSGRWNAPCRRLKPKSGFGSDRA